jgi:hypothetical protein
MRAVFVRRRAETKATPAWMGGLNYEEKTMPKLLWNIDKRALSSDFASALQTRVHTSQSDFDGDEGQRSVLLSRPNTSGQRRLQSARAETRRQSSGALTARRPQTAGAPGTQASHRRSLHLPLDTQQLDERLRTANTFRPATGAGSLTARTVSSSGSTTSTEKAKRAKEHRFYQLQVNIAWVGGSAHGAPDDDSEDGFYNACVTLAIDGTSDGAGQTHVSKTFKASQMAFVPLPENWVEFALTGNVYQMLMAVKMLRRTTDSSKAG